MGTMDGVGGPWLGKVGGSGQKEMVILTRRDGDPGQGRMGTLDKKNWGS